MNNTLDPGIPPEYHLAANRCVATANELYAWCTHTGDTLERAIALVNTGQLKGDA